MILPQRYPACSLRCCAAAIAALCLTGCASMRTGKSQYAGIEPLLAKADYPAAIARIEAAKGEVEIRVRLDRRVGELVEAAWVESAQSEVEVRISPDGLRGLIKSAWIFPTYSELIELVLVFFRVKEVAIGISSSSHLMATPAASPRTELCPEW